MLRHLFPGLTRDRGHDSALMQAIVAEARDKCWYVQGEVPDTVDGRFRMLATLTALTMVRLEAFGDAGDAASVALTEYYADLMETEHREMGLGDPTLGKRVRLLVGALARRVGTWRSAVLGEADWAATARDSVYEGEPRADALDFVADTLRSLWSRIEQAELSALEKGNLG